MSKKKKMRSPEELQSVRKHLKYEVDMLVAVARGLSSGVAFPSPLNNAMVESFAIHARNLIDFLWPEKLSNDRVVARDFVTTSQDWPPLSELLRTARNRAHQEIAHLSYARLKVTPEKKPWHVPEITKEIVKAINKFETEVDSVQADVVSGQKLESAGG